ncbi:Methyltransferase domain-containing protein [Dyadobacter koreensis]|uniref:Methyltransferase domain-containing protein n=1 Tax=Dyadobacter koreensis TaxID=408657 RepID=A0A1H6XST8_9BACT|nr:methyltransferase domain-containing protein [Dyadobacter koreensis]SEJ32113.1 Methyltransferase domain-containing protein [Dyadobacter koreensis]
MFKKRSQEKELLDQEEIPEQDLFRNLRELDFINHWLGGYKISFSGLKNIIKPGHHYNFVDIGCGGGDTLKRIKKWRMKHAYLLDLYGVDLKPVCVRYAMSNPENNGITFICDDYKNMKKHIEKIDIIHACLFCHHLSETELIELIKFSVYNNAILLINDLERNPIAYYSIKILTRLFSRSYLVKNDAPLSVLRGFRKKEWVDILQKSGASRYTVSNKWAFRHQIIIHGNES